MYLRSREFNNCRLNGIFMHMFWFPTEDADEILQKHWVTRELETSQDLKQDIMDKIMFKYDIMYYKMF